MRVVDFSFLFVDLNHTIGYPKTSYCILGLSILDKSPTRNPKPLNLSLNPKPKLFTPAQVLTSPAEEGQGGIGVRRALSGRRLDSLEASWSMDSVRAGNCCSCFLRVVKGVRECLWCMEVCKEIEGCCAAYRGGSCTVSRCA